TVTSTVAHLNLDADKDGLADWWELPYFGSITNQNASMDKDGDGNSNLTEFLDGTNPTNRNSLLTRLTLRTFGGSVQVSPDQEDYQTNDTVILTAVPDSGLTFLGWAGDLAGVTNPATLTMRSNRIVQATFGLPLNLAL